MNFGPEMEANILEPPFVLVVKDDALFPMVNPPVVDEL